MSGKQEKISAKALFKILSAYIEVGELGDFQRRLAANPDYDINTVDANNNSLFHAAMSSEYDIKALNYLISLENITCTIVANKDNKTPIDLAIEKNQLEKLTVLLRFIYTKDKNQLPNLNAHLKNAIASSNADLAEICLLFGATPEIEDVENIKDEKTLIVLCRFGYGIGAHFKFDDAFKGNALPSTLCMVGATVCGKALGFDEYPTAAMVSLGDLNFSDQSVVAFNNSDLLLARLETQWRFWFENIKNVLVVYGDLKLKKLEFIRNMIEGFNSAYSDRFFYLKDTLNEKYQINSNFILNDVNEKYFPPFSLQRLSFDVVVNAVKDKKMDLKDVKFMNKSKVLNLELYIRLFNHPLINLSTEKKNKIFGLLENIDSNKAKNIEFEVDFEALWNDMSEILQSDLVATMTSVLSKDDILQLVINQLCLFEENYSYRNTFKISMFSIVIAIFGVISAVLSLSMGLGALLGYSVKGLNNFVINLLYAALFFLVPALISIIINVSEQLYRFKLKSVETQPELNSIDALMITTGSLALHYKNDRDDEAKTLADIATKLSQSNRLSYYQVNKLARQEIKTLNKLYDSNLTLLPNNFKDVKFFPNEENTFKLRFKLSDLSMFAEKEARIQVLPDDENAALLANSL